MHNAKYVICRIMSLCQIFLLQDYGSIVHIIAGFFFLFLGPRIVKELLPLPFSTVQNMAFLSFIFLFLVGVF